jgi:ribosomal protein L18
VTTHTDPLDALGADLHAAVGRRIARRQRRRKLSRLGVLSLVLAAAMSTVALASDSIGLHTFGLDSGRFTLLGGERTDDRAGYITVRDNQTGHTSVFQIAEDDGLDRYAAFELHQRTAAAAGTREDGEDCSAGELTRAQVVALETLAASFAPGTMVPDRSSPPAHAQAKAAVDGAVDRAFAGRTCSGLRYAGEIALLVYAKVEPVGDLMPGARAAARRALG